MKTPSASLVLLASLVMAGCQSTSSQQNTEANLASTTDSTATKYPEFIRSGHSLPLASIVDIDGNRIDFANNHKRKLVILFATWCSDSNRALKALNQSPLLNDESIEIIAIAREEDAATVKAWRDKHNIKVPLASDKDRSIYKQFAAAGIPRLITVSEHNDVIKMNLAEGDNQLRLIQWH